MQLIAIPFLVVVKRSDFFSIWQNLTENTRSLTDRLKEKSSTLTNACTFLKDGCNQVIDLKDLIILKDVLVTVLSEEDICKEVGKLRCEYVKEATSIIGEKEMIQNVMQ